MRFTRPDGEQSRCVTDAIGAFACASLIAGTYAATVHPGDDASRALPFLAPVAPIELSEDGAIGGLRLAIDPKTTAIVGTVLDETGAPVADAHVRAWGDGLAHYPWSPALATVTDAAGRFELSGLAPGDYRVTAELLDGSRVTTVTLAGGATNATIVLARPACILGAPLDPPHRPASPIAWDDRIELVGWDAPAAAKVGEPVSIALVFRVGKRPFAHAWRVFAHLDLRWQRRSGQRRSSRRSAASARPRCGKARRCPGGPLHDDPHLGRELRAADRLLPPRSDRRRRQGARCTRLARSRGDAGSHGCDARGRSTQIEIATITAR